MSDSVRPHRRQPTRLPHPWDSLGKNTGVGCHFLLQCLKVKSESEVAQSCQTLSHPMDCSLPGSSIHGIFQARVLEWGAIAFFNIYLAHCNLKCREMQCFVSLWETSLEKCRQWLLSSHGIADNRIWASLLCFVNCHPKFGSASHIGSFILSVSWNSLKVLWVWSFGPASPPLGLLHF